MKKTTSFLKRVISVMTIAVLLSQQIMPILVFAQSTDNVDNVDNVSAKEYVSESTIETTNETPSPTPTLNKTDNNVINIPKVKFKLDLDDPLVHTTPKLKSVDLVGKLQKFSNITIDKEYVYELNSDVSVKFSKLPAGTDLSFTIEEVSVDLDGNTLTGYDIKSDMVDGEFSYELVLPNTVGQKAEVQFSEDGATFTDVPNEKLTLDSVAVNADHFTIFVVINPNVVGNGNTATASDCSVAGIGFTCYDTIQAAINASVDGDTIMISAGTFQPSSQIVISKEITLMGAGQGMTIIDASLYTSYGMDIHANNVVIQDLTLTNANGTSSGFGIKAYDATNFSLVNVTVQNSQKTNIDIHGITRFSLTNVTASGAIKGNGIAITDSHKGTLTNVTTFGNLWGGIALYTSTYYPPAGVSNITIGGLVNISESPKMYSEVKTLGDLITDLNYSTSDFRYKITYAALPAYEFYFGDVDPSTLISMAIAKGWGSFVVYDLENLVIIYPDATAPTITDFNIQRSGGWNNGLIIDQKAHYDSTNTYPVIGNTVNLGANFQDAEGNLVTTSLGVHAAWFPGGDSNWAGIPTGNYQFTWNTLADARYNYTTSATDTADGVRRVLFHAQDGISPTIFNYVNEEYSVIVDNTAPTVSYGALTPADGSIFKSSQGTIKIDGDFSDNYGLFDVRLGVSGVAWDCNFGPTDVYTNDTPANGNYSCDVNISSLSDGTYYYAIQGLDKAGNTNNTTTRSFVIDNTAPSVPVNGTPNGTSIPTNNFDFNWDNSTDNSLPITYLFHSSQNPTQVDGILTTGLWTSSILPSNTIHSSGAPDGTWYWQVQAIDSVGNTSEWSEIWSVTLDTVAPTIVFDGFKDQINSTYDGSATTKPCGSFNSTGFISWEWTLSNLENNPVNYKYTIVSGPTAVGFSMTTQNTHVNGAIPVEGTYVVSVTGTDSAGNVGNTIECSVTFDKTSPITTDSGTDSNWHNTNVTVNFTCTDVNGSGCLKTFYKINDGTFVEGNSVTFSANGEYSIDYYSIDNAGNIEEEKSTEFPVKIDKTKPTASIINPFDGQNINGPVVININATDALSGVSTVRMNLYKVGTPETLVAGCTGQNFTYDTASGLWSLTINNGGSCKNLVDATYRIASWAIDGAGNIFYLTRPTFTIDSVFPIIIINNPTTNPAKSKLLTASTNEGVLEMAINPVGTSTCDSTLTFTAYADTTFASEADNGKTICYTATDLAGNTSYSISNAISGIDLTKPTLAVIEPINGTIFNNVPVLIQIQATDLASGIASASMHIYKVGTPDTLVAGCTTVPTVFNTTTGYWEATINNGGSCILSEGTFKIASWAYDNAGNVNWASRPIFIIDITPPVVTAPDDIVVEATSASGATVVFPNTGTAVDSVDGAITPTCLPASDTEFPLGITPVVCSATDTAGNTGTDTFTVSVVDRTPPTTPSNLGFSNPALSCGAYTNIGSNTVNWDDSTDIVGVTGYDYYIEYPLLPTGSGRGVWGTTRTISEYTGTFNPGLHQIKVRAFDAAGNKSEWTELCDINYDIQGPVIDTISNQSYDEGSYIDNLEILNDKGITDDQMLDRFFLNVDYSPFTESPSETLLNTSFDISWINGDGMSGTLNELIEYVLDVEDFDFAALNGILPIDTSIIPEGVYTFTYWAYDMAGNRSTCNVEFEETSLQSLAVNTDCSFSITINNVDPTVTLDADQTIDEGQTASFTGSFTDPSYLANSLFYNFNSEINTSSVNSNVLEKLLVTEESASNYPDDSNWIASMDYGDGSDVITFEPFAIPGVVTIPDHIYTNNGVYTATLEVCEGTETHNTELYGILETTLVSGEGNCDSKTVLVTVNNLVPTVSISSNPGNNVAYGTDVTLTASGLGGNAPLTYLWSGACSGTNETFTLPAVVGTRSCTVTVTDVDGDIATADMAVTVNPMVVTGGTTTTTTTTGQVAGTSTTITATPTPSPTPTGKIAGEDTTGILGLLDQKCTTKYEASGYAFIDANNNGSKDASEVVAANVEVIIYLENVPQEDGSKKNIDLLSVKTNSDGLWKVNVCEGSYKLKVNPNTLPINTKLVLGSIDLNVKSDQANENINLALVDSATGFNWWWLLVLAVLGGIFVLVYKANKSKNESSLK